MRHIWNRRMYALGLPQMRQRFFARVGNLGGLFAFSIIDFLANVSNLPPAPQDGLRKGIPRSRRSSMASSSVRAVVEMVMSSPRMRSTLSYRISGKMICSRTPRL